VDCNKYIYFELIFVYFLLNYLKIFKKDFDYF